MADPISSSVYIDSAGIARDSGPIGTGAAGGGVGEAGIAAAIAAATADKKGTSSLDLTKVGASIDIPVDNGQGVIGVDITGLTNSGATIIATSTVGLLEFPVNMARVGAAGMLPMFTTEDSSWRSSVVAKALFRIKVSVAGTGTATVSWALSTNASLIQLSAPIPPGTNKIGAVDVPTLPLIKFDGAQPVTQSGSWSFSLTGTPTVNANVSFPSVQQVSGTVTANVTFPASQAVTGTFWQTTQPISVASLPLPAGAATATGVAAIVTALGSQATSAKQDSILTALSGRLTVNDYRLPNADAAGAVVPKTAADVTSFIVSAVPCNLFSAVVIGRPDGVGAYVFVLNRTTVPPSGSTINMAEVVAMSGYSAGGGANIAPEQVPDRFTAGCVIIISTSIDTYTPVTGVNRPKFIKARVL